MQINSYERFCKTPRFETEVQGNSEYIRPGCSAASAITAPSGMEILSLLHAVFYTKYKMAFPMFSEKVMSF